MHTPELSAEGATVMWRPNNIGDFKIERLRDGSFSVGGGGGDAFRRTTTGVHAQQHPACQTQSWKRTKESGVSHHIAGHKGENESHVV